MISESPISMFNTNSTYVYFISAGSTPIKIGVSNDPMARLLDLQTAHYQKLNLLYTLECRDRAQAFELENAFHRWYDDVHIRNEWFNLTPKKIAADIELMRALAAAVSVIQHVAPARIERMEKRAEQKIAVSRAGGGQTTDEITAVMSRTVETIDGIQANCPHCGREFVKPTPTSLRLALTAHLRGCTARLGHNGK